MPGRRNRPKPIVALGEALLWILFAALLVPAGFAGWAVGHYTGHTKTVTVGAGTSAPAATTTAAAAPKTTTAAAAPAASGKSIFVSAGCGACHTFKAAGTSGTVGPNLDTAPEKDAVKAKMKLDAFVKESIVSPNAFISPGFPKGVMPGNFEATLGPTKVAALVTFITGGK